MKLLNFSRLVMFSLLLVCAFSGFTASAEDSKITPIVRADVACGDKGVAFYVNAQDKRVWQSELGEPDGIELTVTSFNTARCMGCYLISAVSTLFGQGFIYQLDLKKDTAHIEMSADSGELILSKKFPCQPIQTK